MGNEGGSRLRRAGRQGDLAPRRSAPRCGWRRAWQASARHRHGAGLRRGQGCRAGLESVGVDFSETMLAFARSRSPSVEFVRGDATELPFPADSFDATTCVSALPHRPAGDSRSRGRPRARTGAVLRSAFGTSRRGAGGSAWCSTPSRPRVRPRRPTCRTAHRSSGSQTTASSRGYWLTRGSPTWPSRGSRFLPPADELTSCGRACRRQRAGTAADRRTVLETQDAIRKHFDELLEGYRTKDGDGFAVRSR